MFRWDLDRCVGVRYKQSTLKVRNPLRNGRKVPHSPYELSASTETNASKPRVFKQQGFIISKL